MEGEREGRGETEETQEITAEPGYIQQSNSHWADLSPPGQPPGELLHLYFVEQEK